MKPFRPDRYYAAVARLRQPQRAIVGSFATENGVYFAYGGHNVIWVKRGSDITEKDLVGFTVDL